MTEEAEMDAMSLYQKLEQEVVGLCRQTNQMWVDKEYGPENRSLYKDVNKIPDWAKEIRTVKWLRPNEIGKDVRFMIDKEGDAKQGVFGESWFIGAIVIIASKGEFLDKLIVNSDYFEEYGFVTF